jgi:hypothetical protein
VGHASSIYKYNNNNNNNNNSAAFSRTGAGVVNERKITARRRRLAEYY